MRADRQRRLRVNQRPVLHPAGHPRRGQPHRDFPHAGQHFAATWYSITVGGGGGDASNTCLFCAVPSTGSPDRSCPQQPHADGPQNTLSSGSGDCFSVEDCAPGCLPGLRPDLCRSDRSCGFFLYGLSDDGGLDDVEESLSSRRRSSSTCAGRRRGILRVPRGQLRGGRAHPRAAAASRNRALRSLQLRDPRGAAAPPHQMRALRRIGHNPRSTTASGTDHGRDTPSQLAASLHPAPASTGHTIDHSG